MSGRRLVGVEAADDSKPTIRTYRALLVWQKSIELTEVVYAVTGGTAFPKDERFGLMAQMRRVAVSVPSNIAEGQARRTAGDFVQFLYVARGSLAELDTQALVALNLKYMSEQDHRHLTALIDELQRMLFRLIDKLGGRK